jgi:hypothetical protein
MRRLRLIIAVFLILTLTGCTKEYNLTEEQTEATAEYMAGLLLRYDNNYKPSLISKEELYAQEDDASEEFEDITTPTPTASPIEESSDDVNNEEEKTQKDYTLTEVIGVKNIEIQYSGYQICEYYPEDSSNSYFSLTPREGYQLLVTSFQAKNNSKKDKAFNLSETNVLYQLDINVGTVYKPLLTLLENDLQYIDITIKAGKTETVLLVFEVSKDVDISEINLIALKDERTEIIEIK